MISQMAPAIVRVLSEGPELYGEATSSPMPEPSEMTRKPTAIPAIAPAMAAPQENDEALPPSASMISTFSPMMAASVMTKRPRAPDTGPGAARRLRTQGKRVTPLPVPLPRKDEKTLPREEGGSMISWGTLVPRATA